MPKESFEEILSLISDETERQQFSTLAEKYPAIQEGYLRQADYSKKMAEFEGELALVNEWEEWSKQNWLPEHKMTRGQLEAQQRMLELQKQIEEMGPMDFKDIEKFVQEKGLIGKEDLAKKEQELTQYVGNTFAALSQVVEQTIPLAVQHLKEFDEPLSVGDMFAKANEAGIRDTKAAYDAYVAERRAQRDAEKHKAEVDAAYQRGQEEAKKNIVMGAEGRMPVDMSGPEMGHFQQQVVSTPSQEQKAAQVVPENVELGKGVGHFVAQAYLKGTAGA